MIYGPRSIVTLEDAAEAVFMEYAPAKEIVDAAPGVRLRRDGYVELPRLYHGGELADWLRETYGPHGPLRIIDASAIQLFRELGFRVEWPS